MIIIFCLVIHSFPPEVKLLFIISVCGGGLWVHFLCRNVSGKCDANVSNVLLAAQGGNVKGEIGSAPGVST